MTNYVHILDQHKIDILRTNKSHLTNNFLSCMYFSEKLQYQSTSDALKHEYCNVSSIFCLPQKTLSELHNTLIKTSKKNLQLNAQL